MSMRSVSCALLVSFLTLTPGFIRADEAKETPADKAYAQIRTVAEAPYALMNDHERWNAMSPREREILSAGASDLLIPLGEKFVADHPDDPRRWQVIGMMLASYREFNGAGADERRAAWQKRRAELRDDLLAAKDADERLVAMLLEREVYAATGRGTDNPPDLPKAAEAVERMAKRVPGSDRRRFAERSYVEALKKSDPAAAEALLRKRIAERDINPALAEQDEGMLRVITARREPLELRFTALDGSTIDLADYRGKVVLVDFWATWCVPCMEEMPNVKRVYAKYHDKGFEVIGISFDAAPRNPEKPRSHEKTAEQVRDFVAKEGMPWPQFYDGKWWDNKYSRLFSIGSIPAAFLLGKDGRLVTTDARGEELEAEVRRLLGLPQ